jgi:hypothetical protein
MCSYVYDRWYNGLFNKQTDKKTNKKIYLSDSVKNLENSLIVAKAVSFQSDTPFKSGINRHSKTKNNMNKQADEQTGKCVEMNTVNHEYMTYKSFANYVELYKYIKKSEVEERLYHEITPENSKQKPRFDIDIKKDEYLEYFKEFRDNNGEQQLLKNFIMFGEYIKDLVITNACKVLVNLKINPDISKDFMVFESHGINKISYHIILNRYYQYGCKQSRAFYMACLEYCDTLEAKAIFNRFVDKSIYSKNKPLRIIWSVKCNDTEYRVKKYTKEFKYRFRTISHYIPEIDTQESQDVARMTILFHSLITCTDEAEPLPILNTKDNNRYDSSTSELTDLEEKTYAICKEHIKKWDTSSVFDIGDYQGSKIHLIRLENTYCPICKRVHESNPFCYIRDGNLYWHCGRAEGMIGVFIANISDGNNISHDNQLMERIKNYRLANGKEPIDIGPIKDNPSADPLVFMVFDEDRTNHIVKNNTTENNINTTENNINTIGTIEIDTIKIDTNDEVEIDTIEIDTIEIDTIEINKTEINRAEIDKAELNGAETDIKTIYTGEWDIPLYSESYYSFYKINDSIGGNNQIIASGTIMTIEHTENMNTPTTSIGVTAGGPEIFCSIGTKCRLKGDRNHDFLRESEAGTGAALTIGNTQQLHTVNSSESPTKSCIKSQNTHGNDSVNQTINSQDSCINILRNGKINGNIIYTSVRKNDSKPIGASDLKVNNVKVSNIKMDNVKMSDVKANNVKLGNIKVNDVKVNNVTVNNVKVNNVKVNNIKVNNIKVNRSINSLFQTR